MSALAILFSTFLSSALAADPCRGVKEISDPFSGTVRGAVVRLDLVGYSQIALVQDDKGERVEVVFPQGGASNFIYPPGTRLRLAMADGTVLELSTDRDAPPHVNAQQGTIYTQWQLVAPVPASSAGALAGAAISAVRVGDDGSPVSYRVSERDGQKLQDAARCLAGG